MTRIARAVAVTGAIAALLVLSAPATLAADHGVDIAGFAFSPGSITIGVGDSVTWSNADAQSHTATADDGSFDTGTITSSTPKSVTFSTAGTFAYHCKIHASMTATVIVEGAAAPATDTAVAPSPGASGRPWASWLALAVTALLGWLLARRRFAAASARRQASSD
jgi:plastocyanin